MAGAGLSCVGRAAFLHNVIIGLTNCFDDELLFLSSLIMPHYVKKLGGKFLLPSTILYRRNERLAYKNFWSVGKVWQTED